MAGLGLLALPQPVNLAERAENTGAVLEGIRIRIEDAGRAGAGWDGVGRGEGVVCRRHGLERRRVAVETHSLDNGACLDSGAGCAAKDSAADDWRHTELSGREAYTSIAVMASTQGRARVGRQWKGRMDM